MLNIGTYCTMCAYRSVVFVRLLRVLSKIPIDNDPIVSNMLVT
jgi:hypothetical protein